MVECKACIAIFLLSCVLLGIRPSLSQGVTIGFNRTDNSMVSESMVTIQFPVCILSGSLMENESVNLSVDWVFDTAMMDGVDQNLTFTMANNNMCLIVDVPITDDTLSEDEQVLTVNLDFVSSVGINESLVTIRPNSTSVIIQDNDDITVGFDDPNSSMVGEGMPTQICTSITQGTLQRSITLIVTTSGTAAGNDFGGVMNITFESGDSTSSGPRCLNISTTGDTFLEGDETLVLTLTTLNPRVIISPDTHTLTIQDNDRLNLTVTGGGNVAEGDMISVCAQFNAVTMRSVVVNFTTVGVTATAGSDYVALTMESATIMSGSNMTCINVDTTNDTILEGSETFIVMVTTTDPDVTVVVPNATVTITDDDMVMLSVPPTLSVMEETGMVQVCVTLTGQLEREVLVNVTTTDGTAMAGSDYVALTTTLTFNSSNSNMSCVTVNLTRQARLENNETFNVSIASSDGAVRLTNDVTVVTIQGGGMVTVGFIAGSLMVMEGATERTCVRVNGSMVGRTIMLNLNTSGSEGQLTFSHTMLIFSEGGETMECFNITAVSDDNLEVSTSFLITLSVEDDTGVTVNPATLNVTIMDNTRVTIGFQMREYTVDEGMNASVCVAVFVGMLGRNVIIEFNAVGDTAVAGEDFNVDDMSLTFGPSSGTTQCIIVSTVDDEVLEMDKNAFLMLSTSESQVTLNYSMATLQIAENDVVYIGVTRTAVTLVEGDIAVVMVTLMNGNLGREVMVEYQTQLITEPDGAEPVDFTSTNGSLVFSGSMNSQNVTIATARDNTSSELLERFTLNLVSAIPSALVRLMPNETTIIIVDAPSIIENPQSQFVLPGDNVTFTINASGVNLYYQWFLNGEELSDIEGQLRGTDNQTLSIFNVTSMDLGNYTCTITQNSSSLVSNRTSQPAQLLFLGVPVIDPLRDVGVLVGNNLTLNCTASSQDGIVTIFFSADNDASLMQSQTGLLFLTNVSVDMAGTYRCNATNRLTTVTDSLQVFVITIEDVEDQVVPVGRDASFFCNASGNSDLTYRWGRVSNGIFSETMRFFNFTLPRVSGQNTSNLMIANVSLRDASDYGCSVSLFNDFIGSAFGTLIPQGVVIVEDPMSVNVTAPNDTLTLNCTAVNNPNAPNNLTFLWIFDSSFLMNPTTREIVVNKTTVTSQLIIEGVDRSNDGSYICQVHNRVQNMDSVDSEPANVTVFFAPEVRLTDEPAKNSASNPPSLNVTANMAFNLYCFIEALPAPTSIQLFSIFNGTRTMVNNNTGESSFLTTSITLDLSQNGIQYECVADNTIGTGSDLITITVQDVPDMVNQSLVTNSVINLLKVMLTWPPPNDNNSPITTYDLSYCLLEGNLTSQCIMPDVLLPTICGHIPVQPVNGVVTAMCKFPVNSNISLQILAVNSVGMGPALVPPVTFSTATPGDGQPTPVMRVVTTTNAVVLSWNLPSRAMNSEIRVQQFNYTSQAAGSSSIVTIVVPGGGNTMNFGVTQTDLSEDTPYEVEVIAIYMNPPLTSSPARLSFTTPRAGEQNTIVDDVATSAGVTNISAFITWPSPPNDRFLNQFVVVVDISPILISQRKKRQTMPSREIPVNRSQVSITIPDLPPHSNIAASVNAEYLVGNDRTRALLVRPASFETLQGVSSAPTGLTAVSDVTMLRLQWNPPATPNGIIAEYFLEFSSNAPKMEALVLDARTEYNLERLNGSTDYEWRVRADTNGGVNPGNFSVFVTSRTVPGVFPPSVTDSAERLSESGVFDVNVMLPTTYGPIRNFSVIVSTRQTQPPINNFPEGTYVAYFSVFTAESVRVTLGDGRVSSDGMFNNARLRGDTDYYIYILAYSRVNDRFAFSATPWKIRFAPPLNVIAIVIPIAAVAVILLIILVVLLLVAYFTMTRTPRKRGYSPNDAQLLADGKRKKKGGNSLELRRTRLFSPVLNVGSPDVFTSAGQPTTLICEASGTPAPDVTWTRNDEPLDKERFIQLADGSLFINDTDLQDEGTYVVRATNTAGEAEATVRVTVLRPVPPEPDSEHPIMKVGEFPQKIALLRAEDDEGLEDEYAEVELDWTFTSYAAKLNINKNKNRYINIIPYDHSRVVLSLQDNTPGSDYINGSFIDAYQRPNGYIASQGPIPSTFPDFWRMVWELDSPTIVMVTNLKEEDKVKCHQYWPSYGTTTYGHIQVTLKEVENLAEYSIRTFNVSPLAGQSRVQMPVREVRQFHFLVWPDHGVPQYATNLLSFRKRVLKYHPEKRGPMVVHCSAGVGRTGTYITIDYMLQQMEAEGTINIFNYVRHMRYRRNYMVQTSPQYVFIHDALLETIMCGDNSIKAPELRAKVKEMMAVVEETGKTAFESQFETLLAASPPDDDFDCSVAQLPDNMDKNRSKVHLPANDYRVVLSTDGDQSDYICASYVDNYRERNAFIVTQAPMSNTIGDFWRMIWETKSAAIVMLTELMEGEQEMCVKYWPSGVNDPSVFGAYQIELSEDEKDRGQYITRRFKVSPVDKPQESRMISQFHFTRWTKTTPPVDCRPMIDLIDELQRVQRKSGNMPITVHCDDGVSRTGAFCTLYSVLERVKTEQIVDVFQAVKTLRIQRVGLLSTIAEYEFVHRAVVEFLETFSDYQNFK